MRIWQRSLCRASILRNLAFLEISMESSRQSAHPPGLVNLTRTARLYHDANDPDRYKIVQAFIYGRYDYADIMAADARVAGEARKVAEMLARAVAQRPAAVLAMAEVHAKMARANACWQREFLIRQNKTRRYQKLLELLGLAFVSEDSAEEMEDEGEFFVAPARFRTEHLRM